MKLLKRGPQEGFNDYIPCYEMKSSGWGEKQKLPGSSSSLAFRQFIDT